MSTDYLSQIFPATLNDSNESHLDESSETASTEQDFEDKVKQDREKRFEYLLKQTEIFTHFMKNKKNDSPITTNKRKTPRTKVKNSSKRMKMDENKNFLSQKTQEDNVTLQSLSDNANSLDELRFPFQKSPAYIKNGKMREYQVYGLNWMISLHEQGINGILADEMGLGKTLQAISFLGYLKHFKKISGHHLLIVPLSTLDNWMSEFKKWCPSLRIIRLAGVKTIRKNLIREELLPGKWDVCVSTYETCLIEIINLKQFNWRYVVIDEAHRIKNENTKLANAVRGLTSANRLLLTGTPLQNNLHELWALLNFLLPDVFDSAKDFDDWFDTEKFLNNKALADRLQTVIKPFVLRRIKSIVEPDLKPKKEIKIFVQLSKMQHDWYKKVLMRHIDIIDYMGEKKKKRLLNLFIQLRKVSNHPYLFEGAEEGPPYVEGMHLITNSSKMVILDKLLAKLKAQGSRVLLFSQMTRVLDIIQDYCQLRKHQFSRFDGSTSQQARVELINEFNAPKSKTFIFMMTTRAGGLGINLTSADTVIIFDIDCNPQADLQAEDRAHRIGQKKQVQIFRLITEHSVEERIQERCEKKLHLDKVVMPRSAEFSHETILSIVRADAKEILASDAHELTNEYYDEIIERIGL